MLLGNGFLLNKLPTQYIGNVISNNNFTNPSMMLKTYDSFPQYDSIPAGYGGQAIVVPTTFMYVHNDSHNTVFYKFEWTSSGIALRKGEFIKVNETVYFRNSLHTDLRLIVVHD